MQVNWEPSRITWFGVMRKCGDEVRELLHGGCPVAFLGDAPFGYVHVFTSRTDSITCTYFVAFCVPARKWGTSDKLLKRSGEDETRTRDLCRDSAHG
jgi:hydrogenase maturation factor